MPIRPTNSSMPRQPVTGTETPNLQNTGVGSQGEGIASGVFQDEFVGGIDTRHPQARKALDAYQEKLRKIFNHDAKRMAEGYSPVLQGDTLSEDQTKAVQKATTELFQNLPLNSFSPKMADRAKSFLRTRGVENVEDLGDKPLKDLKPYGGELARSMTEQFKNANPGAFYGLAAGLAVGIGYKAYQDGSKFLDELGVKPEFDQRFFDGALVAKTKASWGAKASDITLKNELAFSHQLGDNTKGKVALKSTVKGDKIAALGVQAFGVESSLEHKVNDDLRVKVSGSTSGETMTHGVDLGTHKLEAQVISSVADLKVKTQLEGDGAHKQSALDVTFKSDKNRVGLGTDLAADGSVDEFRLSGKYSNSGLTIEGKSALDQNMELKSARLSTRYSKTLGSASDLSTMSIGGGLTLGSGGQLQTGTADFSLSKGNWSYKGSYKGNLQAGTHGAELSAGYSKGDLEFHALTGLNAERGAYVGAGLTFRF
ncbi:MAG: hypothetical protein VX405_08095 [Myxococcota bacterium]|nr:hypothetical protein [Myxococcota bacterium]